MVENFIVARSTVRDYMVHKTFFDNFNFWNNSSAKILPNFCQLGIASTYLQRTSIFFDLTNFDPPLKKLHNRTGAKLHRTGNLVKLFLSLNNVHTNLV